MKVVQKDYRTIVLDGTEITVPKRIRQLVEFKDRIAVRLGSKKSDVEYNQDLKVGNVVVIDLTGVVFNYPSRSITSIWKRDESTLAMYDGQTDIWLDINSFQVIKLVWNPWGTDQT